VPVLRGVRDIAYSLLQTAAVDVGTRSFEPCEQFFPQYSIVPLMNKSPWVEKSQ